MLALKNFQDADMRHAAGESAAQSEADPRLNRRLYQDRGSRCRGRPAFQHRPELTCYALAPHTLLLGIHG
jgi:hypothetical protein